MKKILYTLCLTLLLLPAVALAETFELTYTHLEKAGFSAYLRGRSLTALEAPPDSLRGIPDPGSGSLWYLEVQLGEGSNNTYPMVVLLSEDESTVKWLFDANRNGDLADEAEVIQHFKKDTASLPLREFMIPVGNEERLYRAHLELRRTRDRTYFYFKSDCCYLGTIDVEGERYITALVDANTNGLFNDTDWYTDVMHIWMSHSNSADSGIMNRGRRIWDGSVKSFVRDDQWHLFDPEPDGSATNYLGQADDLVGLETGFKKFTLELTSTRTGTMKLSTDDGKVMLPPGEYQWIDYSIKVPCEDEKILDYYSGTIMKEAFTVAAGRTNRLDLCWPITQEITARIQGDEVTFDESFDGRNREDVRLQYAGERWAPSFTVSDPAGRVVGQGTFETG